MPQIIEGSRTTEITQKTQMPSAAISGNSATPPVLEAPQPEQTQQTSTETNPVPRETSPKADAKFIALSKKEKALLQRDRSLKERERQISEKAERYKAWEEAAQLASTNKLEAIKKLGITYDDLTNIALNQQPTPEQIAEMKAQETVEMKLNAFKEEQKQKEIESTQKAYESARQQIKIETQRLVNQENFPLVNSTKAFDTIVELIEQTFHETGEIMSVEAATTEVEQYLEEQALEIAKLDKIRSKILPKEEPKQSPVQATKQQPQTLTHKTTVAPAAPGNSPDERRRRAIEVFYGRG